MEGLRDEDWRERPRGGRFVWWRGGETRERPTTGHRLHFASPFPSVRSILHPPLCPQHHSSATSIPPSVSFHVVTHYSADASPPVGQSI